MSNLPLYQEFAVSKAAKYENTLFQTKLWVVALGGEIGEVANLIKKWLGHSHPLDTEKLRDELGDNFWYAACLCETIGLDFEEFVERRRRVSLPASVGLSSDSLTLILHLQASQGVMASVATYITDVEHACDIYYSSLQRIVAALCALCDAHDLVIDDVLSLNMAKLNSRYPSGFSAEKSLNRV